jgi:ATP phosphoribosyltransferase regulatory subunit
MDLRELAAIGAEQDEHGAILAPLDVAESLAGLITQLRAAGEVVVRELPGHAGSWREAGCDRRIIADNGTWRVVSLAD